MVEGRRSKVESYWLGRASKIGWMTSRAINSRPGPPKNKPETFSESNTPSAGPSAFAGQLHGELEHLPCDGRQSIMLTLVFRNQRAQNLWSRLMIYQPVPLQHHTEHKHLANQFQDGC